MGIEPIIMSAGEMESEWAGFSSDFRVSESVACSHNSSGFRNLTVAFTFVERKRIDVFVSIIRKNDIYQL